MGDPPGAGAGAGGLPLGGHPGAGAGGLPLGGHPGAGGWEADGRHTR